MPVNPYQKYKQQSIMTNKTLVMDYEISKNLEALYDFFIYKITQANIHKDAAQIEEILPMLQDLRDAYAQAEKNAAAEAHAAHG